MPQAFYWVQASGAKGSNHTTDQCRSREDQRGSDQGSRRDDQANISTFPVFGEGAIELAGPRRARPHRRELPQTGHR